MHSRTYMLTFQAPQTPPPLIYVVACTINYYHWHFCSLFLLCWMCDWAMDVLPEMTNIHSFTYSLIHSLTLAFTAVRHNHGSTMVMDLSRGFGPWPRWSG